MRCFYRVAALAALGILTACAAPKTPEPIVVTRDLLKPVSVTCVPATLTAAPEYPDTDQALLAASGADRRYLMLIAGRLLRIQRLSQLEIVVRECQK